MIFIDKMKNMKIYKTPTFLPTIDGNKKKGSAAVLLTPNYNSSKKLMNNPMFVNKQRFQSYYLQKDVSYFVNSKVVEEATFNEGYSEYEYLVELTAAEKNKLRDTDFGLPGERKYPMPDASHVKSAIKFFNYVDKDKEAELAKNIKAKAKKFGVKISVGKTNRLAKYVTEAEIVNESIHNNPVPVFFFKDITPDNIVEAYKAVAKSLPAKVACKVHSGEFGNNNFLRPALWKPLIEYLDGTVVECNTAYEGSRNTTEEHKKTLAKHGWDKLPCEIMDEHGEVELDIPKYNQMNKNYVGAGLLDFNSLVVLSHFKGHTMGGFGGALKQLSIGCASARGKKVIHGFGDEKLGMDILNSHTGKDEDINYDDQIKFTEAMADAASSVHEKFKDNVVYINVLANISKDCDCDAHAAAPSMKDIGILVSTDPVAIDKASIDLIYKSDDPGKDEIIDRIESREGLHIFDACKAIDFGTTDYRLIDLSMLRNIEKNTEKRIDEEEVEERFRYIPEWMNLAVNEAYDNVTTDYNLSRFGNANMIIVGEMHNRKMIEVWDNLLTKFKPEYWICEFADMDECLDDETLKDRMEHTTNGSYKSDGKSADYQYNYWVYELALKHHVKLIGCNPIGKKFKTLDEEFKFREPYMLNTIKKYDKKRCLVQLGDGHLRGIPWSKELQDFSGNYKDDRGIVSDITVSFASPIWEYYHNKSGVKIIRWKHDYDIEKEFQSLNEGYIKSEKDIYYNKDKFDSGEINLCFILGHSGSGKTTMALDHTKGNEDKVDMYCLDDLFCIKDHFTMANLKEYGDLIYQFFNGPGKKYYITWEELKDSNIPGSEYEDKLYPEFVNFAKSYAKSHKDKKYILEGVWLMEHGENKQPYFQPEEFKDYAFYIKGTSMVTSKFRAAKRDVQDIEDKSRSEIIKDFSKIFFKKWKFYTTDEKSLKKFRDYFSKLTPVNEHVTKKDEDYRSKGTIDLNELRPIEVTKGIVQKYQDQYKFLKHIRTDENCKARMFKRKHGDQILCGVCVEEKKDGTKWIQALEVFYEFREYGLGRQLLDYAVTKLGAQYLSVSKKNEIAIQMYEDYGFKRYKETQVMYFYTLDPNCEVEDSVTTEQMLAESSDWFSTGDKIMFFGEDAKFDMQLKKMLYVDRIKTRKQLIELYSKVKAENPFIKYTFPDLGKYAGKNVFFDTYYYTEIFFRANTWALQKGLRLFEDYMQRLMTNTIASTKAYKKVTVFIPILDWYKGGEQMWNFRKSLNPISMIYQYMFTNNINGLKKIFGANDVVFVGDNKYFKMNFSQIDAKDLKKMTMKFKVFVTKICLGQDFEAEDIDTTADNVESPEVIKAQIVDKIEDAKGVDLTAKVAAAGAVNKVKNKDKASSNSLKAAVAKDNKAEKDLEEPKDEVISKAKLNQPKDADDAKRELDIDRLATAIDTAANMATDLDSALDKMDREEIKRTIMDLDANTSTGTINISAARSARISELDLKLMSTELNGKSIKDILEEKPKELPKTDINVASPNAEQWKNLSFINFDKNYNIEKDIIRCFRFFENVSRPISIRNISVEDGSTSEDRVMTYTVDLEDYKAKRFNIKLDIPIMKDNRFLLRGNGKTIQTQFFNMPILKVDEDVAEIISNYMKIRVIKYNTNVGKSLPATGRLIKALNKYTGRNMKITFGDNTMICKKYDLPMDYIDIASVITKIETKDNILYFSQDEIRDTYKDIIGPKDHQYPIGYNKRDKSIISWGSTISFRTITEFIISILDTDVPEFADVYEGTMKPTSCTYTKCKIMNAEIPTIVICAYHEGLRKTLEKANIPYRIENKLTKEDRNSVMFDWIKFNDGYLIYDVSYASSILLNGLKVCPTEEYSIGDVDNRDMYLGFLDDFGGRIKADGLDNFYDCMIDPMTKDVLEFYKLPTDYVTILIYASNLLVDNKFHKHTDTSTRRLRRYELIASYTYKVLSDAYSKYANECKHGKNGDMVIKQSAVIDKFLSDTITSDDSCINALRDIETTNAITTKGPSGMNKDRAYSLDKRTYDDSMLNVLGMSTGFASNVGITRQATLNANIEGEKGYVKNINGDTSKMNTVSSLTAIESLIPFGTTHDDPMRTAMSFVQTAKHQVRTEESDPPLVVNGSEEAMPYISTDRFAFKAKAQGKVVEFDPEKYIILEYTDGTNEYINLQETIEKNSDGGYYVPLKLDAKDNIKVGMRVKEGDILAYDKYSYSNSVGESGNLAYNVGKLAKVAIINTDEGFEDSGVITEKMARSLATRVVLKFDVILDKDTRIISNMKVGEHVEAGQALMVWQAPFEEEEANQLINSLSTTSDEVSELGKRRLTSEVTGKITGIKMFRTVDTKELTPSLKKMVDAYEKPIKEMADKVNSLKGVDKSILDSHTTLSTIGKLKKAEDSVLVEYYVEYLDTVGIGDKIVYFAANKATEKSVIPLGKEPRSSFRPNETVDAFVSEVSIDKRIVTSTLLNGALNKLMIELDRSVKDILGIPYDDSKV